MAITFAVAFSFDMSKVSSSKKLERKMAFMAGPATSTEPTKAVTTIPSVESVRSETVSEDEIAARAYELWLDRGCPIGSPEVDWSRAQEQLKSERN